MDEGARASPSERDDDVTASEVASYEFCAKAWHLERVLGKLPSPAAAGRRVEGIARHDLHGTRVGRLRRAERGLIVLSVALLVLAVALAAVVIFLARRSP